MQAHPRTFGLHFKCSALVQALWFALQTPPGAGEPGGILNPLVIRTHCAVSTADSSKVPHCIPPCLACLARRGEERERERREERGWPFGSSPELGIQGFREGKEEAGDVHW